MQMHYHLLAAGIVALSCKETPAPDANSPPTVPSVACSPLTTQTGQSVICSASGSTDVNGDPVTYVWSATDRTGAATGTSTTYSRSTAGATSVTAYATDGQGGESGNSSATTLTFNDPAPPTGAVITGVSFDFTTHRRLALGSDNWPVTWSDDDHQYTSWGDGGGFGGSDSGGRVSLGFGRIEGGRTSHTGFNVWGGKSPANPAQFDGKSRGIISIGGVLFAWVTPGSNIQGYTEARLAKSTDKAAVWNRLSWAFTQSYGVVYPTILNFGKDYAGARDNYVYNYFINLKDPSALKVQAPGEIVLARVPKQLLEDQSAYEWFAGLTGGSPTWTANIGGRVPVFADPNGVGWNVSVSYNAPLRRYVLITEHHQSFQGRIGMHDAPEPWGPWNTFHYANSFGQGSIDQNTFFWNLSNKWLSADGRDFVLIFTGIGSNDSWNTVQGRFTVGN
jgi:hypothetical protein